MSYIDYTPLRLGILAYKKSHGTYVELAAATGNQVSNSTVARIAKGAIAAPSLDLWLALHQAAPQCIPLPELTPAKGRKKSAAAWANTLLPRLAQLARTGQQAVEDILAKLEKPAKTVVKKTKAAAKAKLGRPAKAAKPKKTAKAAKPVKAKAKTVKAAKPKKAAKTAKPAKPAAKAKTVKTVKPAAKAKTVKTVKPAAKAKKADKVVAKPKAKTAKTAKTAKPANKRK